MALVLPEHLEEFLALEEFSRHSSSVPSVLRMAPWWPQQGHECGSARED